MRARPARGELERTLDVGLGGLGPAQQVARDRIEQERLEVPLCLLQPGPPGSTVPKCISAAARISGSQRLSASNVPQQSRLPPMVTNRKQSRIVAITDVTKGKELALCQKARTAKALPVHHVDAAPGLISHPADQGG